MSHEVLHVLLSVVSPSKPYPHGLRPPTVLGETVVIYRIIGISWDRGKMVEIKTLISLSNR